MFWLKSENCYHIINYIFRANFKCQRSYLTFRFPFFNFADALRIIPSVCVSIRASICLFDNYVSDIDIFWHTPYQK